MLELVDLSQQLSKEDYRRVFPELELRLGECQRAARAAGVPVVIIIEGWDAAGKGSVINRLAQVLDPRGFKVHSIIEPDATEELHAWMWRFWSKLPAAGSIAIFDRSWYSRVLLERMDGSAPKQRWLQAYEDIQQLERQLSGSGTVIVKLWLHIGADEQKSRFKRLEKDPVTAWKVGKEEKKQQKRYDRWVEAVEEMLQRTAAAHAPWTVVESTHGRFARVKVFDSIVSAVEQELDRRASAPKVVLEPMPEPEESPTSGETILDRLDLSLTLDRAQYDEKLDKLQERLFQLEHELFLARIPAAIVFEGSDGGGKGGAIKRLTRGLDPRGYDVVPVGPPTDDEKARHYLWRFWREIPKAGHIKIFDRSWYGRVLVERVEGFCSEDEWQRSYREINEFERQLSDFGTVVVKFWLHIDPDEQLSRFKARQEDSHKQWKITDEDWRNREKWRQYKTAVVDMLHRTSTTYAPWTILEANSKLYARIKALSTVAAALEDALKRA